MDYLNTTTTKKFPTKRIVVVGSLFVALIAGVWTLKSQITQASVSKNSVLTARVQQGEFTIKVAAPGVLVPEDIRWVASNVEGKVERILKKPGAVVSQGDLIVELTNPELQQKVEELNWERQALSAELNALSTDQQTRLLDMKAAVAKTKMQYEQARMRLNAEEILINQGNATVSKLDFESSKLTVAQLKETLDIDNQRTEQLRKNLAAQLAAHQARLSKLDKTIERAEFELASLQVKAPLDGVLQAMPLELGQRVSLGSNVAKFAKAGDLIAELKVPELKASNVVVGQKVIIDTRFSEIEGTVSRIDPAVTQGTVQVDVTFNQALPPEARPDLSVDGEIVINAKANALYIKRPSASQENRTMPIFKLNPTGSIAEKTAVTFGLASSTEIEVVAGLTKGDTVIISEQTQLARHESITLN
ncbi:efflux RND transporter periplasmic adaptor subunit [Pseudoalteromonas xiamenensis]